MLDERILSAEEKAAAAHAGKTPRPEGKETTAEERYYMASQSQLIWRKFRHHKLAGVGLLLLLILYATALFCEFIAPYGVDRRDTNNLESAPTKLYFFDDQNTFSLAPFVYGMKQELDMKTLRRSVVEDRTKKYYLQVFAPGEEYKLWGLIPFNRHLFQVQKPAEIHIFGTDGLGRDLFSRILYGGRVSLTVGLAGVLLSFILGCFFGGISGYYGGLPDLLVQRLIEFLMSLPTLPLWMGLSAALPPTWSPIKTYFGISLVLSILGWTSLARVVRGKLISLREEDFVMAAKLSGVTETNIITKHLLPDFFSYLIVRLTLAVPGMILGETALSFLGLGIRPPAVSWGVLLQDAQSVKSVVLAPWLLVPALFVIVTVFAFNFVGDGLRDAADPYSQ
jgi:peptide/nickel transport system permease protein